MDRITALYLRVSTEAQADEGYSLPAQAEKLEAYCRMKGIGRYEKFIDGGYSGSHLHRPAMETLIARSKQGEIERVVVYKLDRLSRSQKDTLFLIEDVFLPQQVDFVSINENIDTGSPYGRAMIGILSAFAQLERENIFLRTRMGMVERVKQGYWPGGGRIPFGYDYDATQGILVPNADAPVVREIYRRYLAGESTGRIARACGLRYEHLVTQILRRKSNTGVIVYKGVTYPGRHEALVDEQTFSRAAARLQRREKPRAAPGGKLLSGLLVCGHCGAKMRYQKWGKAGDKLVCYSRDKSKPHLVHDANCPNCGIMAREVEQIVLRDLSRLAVRPPEQDSPPDETVLAQTLKKARDKLTRLYHLYAEAADETLRDTIEKVKTEVAHAAQALQEAQIQNAAPRNEEARQALKQIGTQLASLTDAQKQTLVRACVDKIVLQNGKISLYYAFDAEQESAAG